MSIDKKRMSSSVPHVIVKEIKLNKSNSERCQEASKKLSNTRL